MGRPGPHPRVDGASGRQGGHRLGVGAGEQQALFGEGVEGGGLDPGVAVGADVVPPEGVYDDQDDVQPSPAGRYTSGSETLREAVAPGQSSRVAPAAPTPRSSKNLPQRPSISCHQPTHKMP